MRTLQGGDEFFAALSCLYGSDLARPCVQKDGKSDGEIAREYLHAVGGESNLGPFMQKLDECSIRSISSGERKLEPVEGVGALLGTLGESGVTNGIYTGNTAMRARVKIEAAGLDWGLFDERAVFCQGSRPSRFHEAERVRHAFPSEKMIVVGDAQADYELALVLNALFWHVGDAKITADPRVCLGESPDFSGDHATAFLKASLSL